jgi:hypothetical protein
MGNRWRVDAGFQLPAASFQRAHAAQRRIPPFEANQSLMRCRAGLSDPRIYLILKDLSRRIEDVYGAETE